MDWPRWKTDNKKELQGQTGLRDGRERAKRKNMDKMGRQHMESLWELEASNLREKAGDRNEWRQIVAASRQLLFRP